MCELAQTRHLVISDIAKRMDWSQLPGFYMQQEMLTGSKQTSTGNPHLADKIAKAVIVVVTIPHPLPALVLRSTAVVSTPAIFNLRFKRPDAGCYICVRANTCVHTRLRGGCGCYPNIQLTAVHGRAFAWQVGHQLLAVVVPAKVTWAWDFKLETHFSRISFW